MVFKVLLNTKNPACLTEFTLAAALVSTCPPVDFVILLLSLPGETVEQSRRAVKVFTGALRNPQHSCVLWRVETVL